MINRKERKFLENSTQNILETILKTNICSFIILSRKLKVNISILTQFLLLANW